ncbi:MAG: ferredoxin--NADP+ reductase [Granulosicoccus sp.]|jgi:ferredoxin--NADP+ reductase
MPSVNSQPQPSAHPLTSAIEQEQVLSVHHWNENYFSFRTTRDANRRFDNGQF